MQGPEINKTGMNSVDDYEQEYNIRKSLLTTINSGFRINKWFDQTCKIHYQPYVVNYRIRGCSGYDKCLECYWMLKLIFWPISCCSFIDPIMEHVLGQNTTQYGGMDTITTFLLMILYHQLEDHQLIDDMFTGMILTWNEMG